MNDAYVLDSERATAASPGLLDYLRAGADIYRQVIAPTPASPAGPPRPVPIPGPLASRFNLWAIGAALVAGVGLLLLLLRRGK